jgi:hypothetical protein
MNITTLALAIFFGLFGIDLLGWVNIPNEVLGVLSLIVCVVLVVAGVSFRGIVVKR